MSERSATDMLRAVCEEMERAIAAAHRPKGGQHAGPPKSDFYPANAWVLSRYEQWVREIRRVLDAVYTKEAAMEAAEGRVRNG